MWRLRSATTDVLTSSQGFQLKQKDVLQALIKLWKKMHPDKVPDKVGLEKVGYRIRILMMQARNAHMGMWTVPTRYQALTGMFRLARIESPPGDGDVSRSQVAEDADEDGILAFEHLQQLDDSSSSEVEVTGDSSFLKLGDLANIMDDIFKPMKRVNTKSPSCR